MQPTYQSTKTKNSQHKLVGARSENLKKKTEYIKKKSQAVAPFTGDRDSHKVFTDGIPTDPKILDIRLFASDAQNTSTVVANQPERKYKNGISNTHITLHTMNRNTTRKYESTSDKETLK